ncbi:TIGR03752 family integrating conjugative element protein [Vibrio owensii]|uniref:TIGR03752 family integrating conjugative element protein n=1 Tax=Vibrio owensii TaxID=696485 RepID=UPI0018F19556|nr:TIGR03752 family integrating conjugative element protein [Vibrio owensii]
MKTSHILILGALAAAIAVALMSGGGDGPRLASAEGGLDETPTFSGVVEDTGAMSDSTSDTLRTLIAENKSREREYAALVEKVRKLERGGSADEDSSTVIVLQNQLRNLQDKIVKLEAKQDSTDAILEAESPTILLPAELDVPSDSNQAILNDQSASALDFNSLVPNLVMPNVNLNTDSDNAGTPSVALPAVNGVIWIEPSDMIVTTNKDGQIVKEFPKRDEIAPAESDELGIGEEEKVETIPYMTVPANSTLVDSVAMTAVIGRVPQSGTVMDPYRFKVLVGSDNLATNSHTIPNLDSIVMSGVAKGDFSMKCVSGQITSVTYTFIDGTVSTFQTSDTDPIGFIADEYGVPCVPGEYLSNADEYLATKAAMGTVSSIAGALAQGEVTSLADGGTVSSVVTGDSLVHATGKGVSQGVQEASDWLDERQASAFDAVFLPVGTELSVHIEREIKIDYAVDGRRVSYKTKEGLL